jgi:hypothetical protein
MQVSARPSADGAGHVNGTAAGNGGGVEHLEHLDVVHQSLLPAPANRSANGHADDEQSLGHEPADAAHSATLVSMNGHLCDPPVTTAEASAQTPQQTAADASTMPQDSAARTSEGMPVEDLAATDSLPSLGTLSTQEHRRPPEAEPSAAAGDASLADNRATTVSQPAPVPEVDVQSSAAPQPVPGAAVTDVSSAPAQAGSQPPPSELLAVPALASEPILADGMPDSVSPAAQGDPAGPVTPGTVSALADLLSTVSIRSAIVTPPSAKRKQDVAVGLIYDEAMELHHGPPSASLE